MVSDPDIWNEIGTLTLDHDEQGAIALPPAYEPDDKTGPLREILGTFLAAAPEVRSRFSMVLENGQAFNDRDISELLSRPDCPVR
ncbi:MULTISPECIES: hypothetical protein [Sphingobium]|jgi:hypothetical protein|uniref:Uncharacterized protein n=2 Tax=Sphingobium TaxID=165695 RepID=T0HFJ2_9SPHN|nr:MULTISPECIES: hypothetical protein [Sphingobium]EQB10858.1 hypothetical protein RLDS_25820 [Sphingobium lactosutens DS20]QDC36513.1 hypothetical protein FIL70_03890 [Sphingobium fuliginis ATCC 27551]